VTLRFKDNINYDMDQVFGAALKAVEKEFNE